MRVHLADDSRVHAFCGPAASGAVGAKGGRQLSGGRRQRIATAGRTSSASGRGSNSSSGAANSRSDGGGGSDELAHPGWEPACACFLAQELDISSAVSAGWLDTAARKFVQDAAKQPARDTSQAPTMINLAEVQQLLDVLSSVIGMPPAGIASVLRKWPRYLACQPAQPRGVACFLRQEVGLTAKQAATLLRAKPVLLGKAVEVLRQRREALQRSLGLSDAQLQRVIGGVPTLLTFSAAGIEERYCELQEWCNECGWTSAEVAEMVSAQPPMLKNSIATLQTNFDRLVELCSFSQQEAAAVVRSWAHVLHSSMDTPNNLRKLDFFKHVIKRPLAALAHAPAYVSYSLTYFIRERGNQLSPSLRYLVSG